MNGDVRIDDHSKEYLNHVARDLETALTAVGIHIEGEAKEELENSPRRIDTGLLRNSITWALDGEAPAIQSYSSDDGSKSGSYSGTADKESGNNRSVTIGSNVEYGEYVHDGTVNMSPNRFLKNAVVRNKDQITQYIKDAMS